MSCVTKHIDNFCNNFLSLNINLSNGSGPTLEVDILGEPDYTKNHREIVEGVLSRLKESNVPIYGSWMLLSASTTKSSSGVITKVRMIDSVWVEANSTTIGVNMESGGDIMLGSEYFNVNGVAVNSPTTNGSLLMSAENLRKNYYSLNSGKFYISQSGSILAKPSNLTPKEFLKTYMPGLPNPYVEFGSFYYTFDELTRVCGVRNTNGMYGLYNNSGTKYEVLSSIGSTFGRGYVANSMWGSTFIDYTEDDGKVDVLTNKGISPPSEAVSSSFEIDYSSGHTWNATKIVKSPGRYKTDEQNNTAAADIDDDSRIVEDEYVTLTFRTNYNGFGGMVDTKYIWGRNNGEYDWNKDDFAYTILRETDLFKEYCLAYYISKNATKVNVKDYEWYERVYGITPGNGDPVQESNYEWYTNVQGLVDSPSAALLAGAESLSRTREAYRNIENGIRDFGDDCLGYFQNYNRFQVATHFGNENFGGGPLTTTGAGPVDNMGDAINSVGVFNFGSTHFPKGGKNWVCLEGDMTFYTFDTGINEVRGLENVKNFGISNFHGFVDEVFNTDWNYDEPDGMQGAFVVDFGENKIPTLDLSMDLDKYQSYLDFSPSIRDGANGDAALNGVAAVNVKGLQAKVEELHDELKEIAEDLMEINPDFDAEITSQGFKNNDPSNFGRVSGGGPFGQDVRQANLSEEDQKASINEVPQVFRKQAMYSCSPSVPGDKVFSSAYKMNKKQFDHIVDYSWSNSWKDASGNEQPPISYMTESGEINHIAYSNVCVNGKAVPYIEKISFSLVNSMYDNYDLKYLESLSMSQVDGKLTANYTFSQKSMMPDYKGLAGTKVKLQNMI